MLALGMVLPSSGPCVQENGFAPEPFAFQFMHSFRGWATRGRGAWAAKLQGWAKEVLCTYSRPLKSQLSLPVSIA